MGGRPTTSPTRTFLKSPLRVMLVLQLLAALATGAFLVTAVLRDKYNPGASDWLASAGASVRGVATGSGGILLLWAILIPLAALALASFVMGLVYGRWGLPGHLQGRAVFVVPPLAVVYFVAGALTLFTLDTDSLGAGWRDVGRLLTHAAGLTLTLIYMLLSTAAVGLGWAISLAVTHRQRASGRWETVNHPLDAGR